MDFSPPTIGNYSILFLIKSSQHVEPFDFDRFDTACSKTLFLSKQYLQKNVLYFCTKVLKTFNPLQKSYNFELFARFLFIYIIDLY